MKTKFFPGILVLFLAMVNLASCNKDDVNKWYDSMPDGGPFHTGNVLRFFYVDEDGNDLIDLADYSTLPVSSTELLDSQPVIESLYKDYSYNNDYNSVVYNENRGMHEFFTFAFGDSRFSSYTFYVYHNGVADKMDVTFKYQDSKVHDGLYYLANNISWSVNGVEVYNIKKPSMKKYIFLVKKSDGTTNVFIEE